MAKKKTVKRVRKIAKPAQEFKSYASVYAATLARQVAAEIRPLHRTKSKGEENLIIAAPMPVWSSEGG